MNKKEYTKLENASVEITEKAKALLVKFNELGIRPSVKREDIEQEYKTIQFGKLLAVDKGLKMRFEMCRTEDAKKKIISDNVNLDGWDIIDELMIQVEQYLRTQPHEFTYTGVNATSYLVNYEGDFNKAFGSRLRDVTETELYMKFKNLENVINELSIEIPYLNDSHLMMDILKDAYRSGYGKKEVELQENFIIKLIDYNKDREERIAQSKKDSEELKKALK